MKTLSRLTQICIFSALVIFLTGCIGMGIRNQLVDDLPFQKAVAQAAPASTNQARIWIYVVGGGPNVMNTAGDADWLTFNDSVHSVGGNSYRRLDLPAGSYEVTCNGVNHKTSIFKYRYEKGKIRTQMDFKEGQQYFMRVDMNGTAGIPGVQPSSAFKLVDREQAEKECEKLKHWKVQVQQTVGVEYH